MTTQTFKKICVFFKQIHPDAHSALIVGYYRHLVDIFMQQNLRKGQKIIIF